MNNDTQQPVAEPIQFQLAEALSVIANAKRIDLHARKKKVATNGDRYVPVYGPKDIGPALYRKIIDLYRKNLPIQEIIKRVQQARIATGEAALSMIDIYGNLASALAEKNVSERDRHGEFSIASFTLFFNMWRKKKNTRDIRTKLGSGFPGENVYKAALRSMKSRFMLYGNTAKIEPSVLCDIPIVEMLRYAERHTLSGNLCMVIPIMKLPMELKTLLKELYCFKSVPDKEFNVQEEVLKELQNIIKPEFREAYQKSLDAYAEKVAQAESSPPTQEMPRNRPDPTLSSYPPPIQTPSEEPFAGIQEIKTSFVPTAAQGDKAPPVQVGSRFRTGGVGGQPVYETKAPYTPPETPVIDDDEFDALSELEGSDEPLEDTLEEDPDNFSPPSPFGD